MFIPLNYSPRILVHTTNVLGNVKTQKQKTQWYEVSLHPKPGQMINEFPHTILR